jgi:hypothetical protein
VHRASVTVGHERWLCGLANGMDGSGAFRRPGEAPACGSWKAWFSGFSLTTGLPSTMRSFVRSVRRKTTELEGGSKVRYRPAKPRTDASRRSGKRQTWPASARKPNLTGTPSQTRFGAAGNETPDGYSLWQSRAPSHLWLCGPGRNRPFLAGDSSTPIRLDAAAPPNPTRRAFGHRGTYECLAYRMVSSPGKCSILGVSAQRKRFFQGRAYRECSTRGSCPRDGRPTGLVPPTSNSASPGVSALRPVVGLDGGGQKAFA